MTPEEKRSLADVAVRREAPRASLEERLTLIEDKEAIRDVIAAYGFLCDAAMWDELLELYTDDIERVLTGSLEEYVQGKDALRELYLNPVLPVKQEEGSQRERLNAGLAPGSLSARHLISHHVTRVGDDGTEAWSSVQYSLVLERTNGDDYARGVHEGAYEFWFLKQDGRWKVRKLTVIANSARNPINQRMAMT